MVACDVKTSLTKVVPHTFLLRHSVLLQYVDAHAVAAQGASLTKWLQRLRGGGYRREWLCPSPRCSIFQWNQVGGFQKGWCCDYRSPSPRHRGFAVECTNV